MILFPNCKINLGLRVMGRRADGYHDIETIFYPLPLEDAAELTCPPGNTGKEFELVLSGLSIPGNEQDNLCYKAFRLIKKDFPAIEPVRLHLLKAIPAGAGLGGGSSDGAHTLLLLNQVLGLELEQEKLMDYALQLGSDCPFFILNEPCFATGRGEQMKACALDLKDYYFVLVCPEIHVSTAWAFGRIVPDKLIHTASLPEIISLPVDQWKNKLINDFEVPVFEEYESLKIIRDQLYDAGAAYASLTGTGSGIYGIFHRRSEPDLGKITSQYKVYNLKQNR